MSNRRRLIGNLGSLFSVQGANYLIPLITLPYLVRVLGPENYGLIAFAQAFIQYFTTVTNYGFGLSAVREVAQIRDQQERLATTIGSVMGVKVLLLLACLVPFALIVWEIPRFRADAGLYAVTTLSVAGAVFFPSWLLQGLERMKVLAGLTIAARLLSSALIFVLVLRARDYLWAAALQSAPLLLATPLAWFLLVRYHGVRIRWPNFTSIWQQFRSGWTLFLSTVAINLYTSSNTFILGLIAGPVAVGYFAAASKLVGAAQGLLSPFSQTFFPHISHLATRSREQARATIRRILHLMASGSFLLSLTLLLAARPLVTVLLGTQYGASVAILRWMAFLPFVIALSNVFGIMTMIPFHLHQSFNRILTLSAVFNLILIVPLVTGFGASGAGMAMLTTECFVTLAMAGTLAKNGLAPWRRPGTEPG